MPVDYSKHPYTAPAERIRALNVAPPHQHIFDGLRKYETAVRGTSARTILALSH